jgi:hypothetical protein
MNSSHVPREFSQTMRRRGWVYSPTLRLWVPDRRRLIVRPVRAREAA